MINGNSGKCKYAIETISENWENSGKNGENKQKIYF
jgi:hypothetical protein